MVGGEPGTGGKDETNDGENPGQEGVQSRAGSTTEEEGGSPKEDIVTDELIKRAAGIDAEGDEEQTETANELADNNEEEKEDESNE